MDWILNNIGAIIEAITAIMAAASIVAKITPNKTDNRVVGHALQVVDLIALTTGKTKIR